MTDNIFANIKDRLNMRSVALEYGFTPNRSNFICCPFHTEKTASMKLYDDSFHCFGCGVHGDCISFVSKLYNLTPIESAKKLDQDLGLNLNVGAGRKNISVKREINRSELLKYYQTWEKSAFRIFNDYYKLLQTWYKDFAPKSPDDEPYSLWVRACHELPLIEYYCLIFIQGTDEERKDFFIHNRKEVDRVAAEYRKYTGA